MYHHVLFCSFDIVSFVCSHNELTIISTKYAVIKNNAVCHNSSHLNSLQFVSECNVSTSVNAHYSSLALQNESKSIPNCSDIHNQQNVIYDVLYRCDDISSSDHLFQIYCFCIIIICILSLFILCKCSKYIHSIRKKKKKKKKKLHSEVTEVRIHQKGALFKSPSSIPLSPSNQMKDIIDLLLPPSNQSKSVDIDECVYLQYETHQKEDKIVKSSHFLNNSLAQRQETSLCQYAQFINFDDLSFVQCEEATDYFQIFNAQWKNSQVCVKMYNANYPFDKIENEFKIIDKIGTHPHIATFYGFTVDYDNDENEARIGLILQSMSHGTAQKAIKNQKFGLIPSLLMFKNACCGLMHLHNLSISHRNFSAKCILLDVSGKCVIANFDQCDDDKNEFAMNRAADICAFGMAMYHILTAQVPVLSSDQNVKLSLPQMHIPDDIYLLITKCVDSNPVNRPSAEEIVSILSDKLFKYREQRRLSLRLSMRSNVSNHSVHSSDPSLNLPKMSDAKNYVSAPSPISLQSKRKQLSVNMNERPRLHHHFTYNHYPPSSVNMSTLKKSVSVCSNDEKKRFYSRTPPAPKLNKSQSYSRNFEDSDDMKYDESNQQKRQIIDPMSITLAKINSGTVFD